VTRLGEPVPLDARDELLLLALEQQQLAHIASQELSLNRQTGQLVVVPLIAGSDTMVGVLAVTRMPFFALNVENLQMMSVILSYYADSVRSGPAVHAIQQRLPGIPAQFAEELARMRSLQARTGMGSQIMVMRFEGERSRGIPAEFLRIKRGLDVYWQTEAQGQPMIAVLMPLASPAAMAGFMMRIEQWLDSRFQGTLDSLGVRLQPIDFDTEDPVEALTRILAPATPA
jgi:polysaccharide biosynthesis protein PelD